GNGVPSGSRGAVSTTSGCPHGQRWATPRVPRGVRPSGAATITSSACVIIAKALLVERLCSSSCCAHREFGASACCADCQSLAYQGAATTCGPTADVFADW